MFGKFALSACALALTGMVGAAPARTFPVAEKPVPGDVYPDRVTRFPGGVTGLADVVYSSITGHRADGRRSLSAAQGQGCGPETAHHLYPRRWLGRRAYPSGSGLLGLSRRAGETGQRRLRRRLARISAGGRSPLSGATSGRRAADPFPEGERRQIRHRCVEGGAVGRSAGGHLAALGATSCGARGSTRRRSPQGPNACRVPPSGTACSTIPP